MTPGPGATIASAVDIADCPLTPGDLWRYRTRTTAAPAGSGDAPEQSGFLDVRVLSRHRHGLLTVLAISRRRDVPDEDGEFSFLVIDGTRRYAVTDPERLRAILSGAPQVLDPGDAEMDFPLEPGKRWGRAAMLQRGDGLYVNQVGPFESVDVPAGRCQAVPIMYRTLPDQITTWVARGTGIVRYEYVHHGSSARELWDLVTFRSAAVDTAALARGIGTAFGRLLAGGSFWSRRTALASDPTLQGLLGPLVSGETVDLEDGIRRYFVRGDSTSLVLEQIPDGPTWAYLLRWKDRAGLIRTFLEPSGPADPVASESGSAVAPPRRGADGSASRERPLAVLLEATRRSFLEARELSGRGLEAEAGARMEAAASHLADGLSVLNGPSLLGLSPESLKVSLRSQIGEKFLTTRYARRVRIDDGRLHVVLEDMPGRIAIEVSMNGEAPPHLGAAPRLLRSGPRGIEVLVLGAGDPSPAPRRVLSLDWSSDPNRPAGLVWRGASASVPPAVELFRFDESGAHAVWRRTLSGGSARLVGDLPQLEVDYDEPDREEPALRPRWRETYAPSPDPDSSPTLLSRELLNPWIGTLALLLHALRAGDRPALADLVHDGGLTDRLAASWLARRSVSLRAVQSPPAGLPSHETEPRVSVTLVRSSGFSPEDMGPERYVLEMMRATGGRWKVADLHAEAGGPEP